MLHQLRKVNPAVDFQPVNRAAVCKYMKMITPAKLLRSLRDGVDEIVLDREIADRARLSVERMIAIGHPVADGRVSCRPVPDPTERVPDAGSPRPGRPRTRGGAPPATWPRRRCRRARIGCGRAVGRAGGAAGAQRARGDQGHLVGRVDAVGPGWARRGARPERHPRGPRARHARSRRRAVRRGRRARAGDRGAEVDPLPDAARRGVRPGQRRHRHRAHAREGGHSHNRIVHAGGDQSGAEVQRTLDESAIGAGVEVLERRVRARPRARHADRWRTRRQPACASPCSTRPAVRRSVGIVTARAVVHRVRRLRSDLRVDVEPARGDR